jgi:hypothetical protein
MAHPRFLRLALTVLGGCVTFARPAPSRPGGGRHSHLMRYGIGFACALLIGLALPLSPANAASPAIGTVNWTTIDYPGADWTVASGINVYGVIVGTYHDLQGMHGFRYSGGQFTSVDVPGDNLGQKSTVLFGINDLGQVVGWFLDRVNAGHSFLLSSGTYTSLDACVLPPQGVVSGSGLTNVGVHAINNAGQTAGSYWNTSDYIYETLEGYSMGANHSQLNCRLDWSGSIGTEIYGINNSGQMVGEWNEGTRGRTDNHAHGLLWSATGQRQTFDPPWASQTFLRGISNSGRMVGYAYVVGMRGYHGLVYENGAPVRLDYPGSTSTMLLGINDPLLFNRYQIVGSYWNVVNGRPKQHGVVATVYPDALPQ